MKMKTPLRGNAIRTIGSMLLIGCAEPAPADHTAPDLGECIGLAASDGGVAHVYAYPNGHPCEGGTCQQGECVP